MASSNHAVISYSELTGSLPLVDCLSWGLGSEVEFTAGEVLSVSIAMENSQVADEWLYMLGALYSVDDEGNIGSIIGGTEFGIYLPEGSLYASNSGSYVTAWEVVAGDSQSVDCQLSLGYSQVVLQIVLLEMAGADPVVTDTIRGSVNCYLYPPASNGGGLSMDLIGGLMMVGVMGAMMGMMSKNM